MLTECIRCHTTWGDEESVDGLRSHGLCRECLVEALIDLYRRRQRREGNPDCCGRSLGHCERVWCSFHAICVHRSPTMTSGGGHNGFQDSTIHPVSQIPHGTCP
jgi:hypothetical protein